MKRKLTAVLSIQHINVCYCSLSIVLMDRFLFQDLKDYMRQAGEVTYADAHKQRKNEG